jgi:hypothetical protein
MTNKSPAFQFYPKDLLSDGDAIAMPSEAFGIYVRLLCYDWIDDGIRDDGRTLKRLSGFDPFDLQGNERRPGDWDIILEYVLRKFVPHPEKPGFLTNPRLCKEREHQRKRSESAQKNAEMRWKKGDANASDSHDVRNAMAMRSVCSPSASTTASPIDTNTPLISPRKPKKVEPAKTEYAKHVLLTQAEHSALVEKFGAQFVTRACEKLSGWIESDPTPKRIRNGKNAAATFRSWVLNAVAEEESRAARQNRSSGLQAKRSGLAPAANGFSEAFNHNMEFIKRLEAEEAEASGSK